VIDKPWSGKHTGKHHFYGENHHFLLAQKKIDLMYDELKSCYFNLL